MTAAVWQRRQAFTAHEIVEPCVSMLRTCAEENGTEVAAYCFMPDHVHLLLAVREEANLTELMRIFKQRTGYRCKQLLEWDGPFWQKSYYDHVLRGEERLESVAAYVWGNPVRAGLVEDADDYPFSGTLLPKMRNANTGSSDLEG